MFEYVIPSRWCYLGRFRSAALLKEECHQGQTVQLDISGSFSLFPACGWRGKPSASVCHLFSAMMDSYPSGQVSPTHSQL